MSLEDRVRWDERHRRASLLKPRPSVALLPRAASPGLLALDLACGQGRHTSALRSAGYDVVAMDVSREALRHVRALAESHDDVHAVQADADAWPFAPASFDVVVQTDFLDRSLFAVLRSALRPGGLLLIDTFLDAGHPNAEGPSRAAFVLKPGELVAEFGDLEVLRCEELDGPTARALLLGRRR